jgi:hypothetical protein
MISKLTSLETRPSCHVILTRARAPDLALFGAVQNSVRYQRILHTLSNSDLGIGLEVLPPYLFPLFLSFLLSLFLIASLPPRRRMEAVVQVATYP